MKAKRRSFRYKVLLVGCLASIFLSTVTIEGQITQTTQYGLEWPGDDAVRRMLFWNNPFPIYDATYIFKVYPRKKSGSINYYTTFFWGNNGTFTWDGGKANTYYGAHPYPVPPPGGAGQWEIAVNGHDHVTGTEVEWDRWYTQAFRAWRESTTVTHHEFYYDLPDTSKVLTYTVDSDPSWADQNPRRLPLSWDKRRTFAARLRATADYPGAVILAGKNSMV